MRADGRTATSSERQILTLLRQEPDLSRAELGRRMGLAGFSVSRIADGLLARGLLCEGAPVVRGRGQPAAELRLRGEAAHSVGISLMTDAASLVLSDLAGQIVARRAFRLDSVEIDWFAGQARSMIDEMLAERRLDRTRLLGVGLGVTGYFIGRGSQLNPPEPLDPWALVDLEPLLGEQLGLPVWVDNDGNAAAQGEASIGAGLRYPSFAYLFFAAGFGGGVVIDGTLMRGRHGNAGEFGAGLPPGYPVPSLSRLRRLVVEESGQDVGLADLLADIDLDRPGVGRWLDEAADGLNIIISQIAGAFDPDAIVLGGRLPVALGEAIIPRLRFQNPPRRGHARPAPVVIASQVAEDATAVGAATLPLQAAFFT